MQEKTAKSTNFDELPLLLTTKDIANLFGISLPTAYELTRRTDFPTLRVSERRIVIPKDAFKLWVEEHASYKIGG